MSECGLEKQAIDHHHPQLGNVVISVKRTQAEKFRIFIFHTFFCIQ